jgi:2-dehydropantoate 2-reductase
MRILVIGAGATGGYFGGRLLQAGRDVTFFVRPQRAARLAETGLVIKSDTGDANLPSPPTVLASELRQPFDVVLLSCKSYDLDSAIDAFAPAVGAGTVIIPLLNGMRHLDVLDEKFGPEHVFGGQCIISARLDPAGRIVHLSDVHSVSFGSRNGSQARQAEAVAATMSGAGFEARASDDIMLEMWEKWVLISALGGITCLTRSAVGDVVAAGGADLSAALLEECRAIAVAAGQTPRPAVMAMGLKRFTAAGSPLTASMLSDVERGGPTEADHILGDLLKRRGETPTPDHSLLRIAYTAVKAAEARKAREKSVG